MTFILEGKYENILGKYRKVISSKVILIGKGAGTEAIYKNKYLESKINSCKGEIKTDLYINGLPHEKVLWQ